MKYSIEKLSPERWHAFSMEACEMVLGEHIDPNDIRIDFALMLFGDNTPFGFITCRETDRETVYLQHGGAFAPAKNSVHVFNLFRESLTFLCTDYNYAWCRVKNTNFNMIKLGMKAGFGIEGIYRFEPNLFLEMRADLRIYDRRYR